MKKFFIVYLCFWAQCKMASVTNGFSQCTFGKGTGDERLVAWRAAMKVDDHFIDRCGSENEMTKEVEDRFFRNMTQKSG